MSELVGKLNHNPMPANVVTILTVREVVSVTQANKPTKGETMSISPNELLNAGILLWFCLLLAIFGFELTRPIGYLSKYTLYGIIMIVWFGGLFYLYKTVAQKDRAWFASGKELLCKIDTKNYHLDFKRLYLQRRILHQRQRDH